MSTVPNFLDFTINAVLHPTFIQKLSYKLSSIVTFTFIQIFLSKLCLLYWMASELPRLLDTPSKIHVIFGVRSEICSHTSLLVPTSEGCLSLGMVLSAIRRASCAVEVPRCRVSHPESAFPQHSHTYSQQSLHCLFYSFCQTIPSILDTQWWH